MADLADIAVNALVPYVGSMVADTCVRATALTLGKSRDTLCADDMPALAESIRRLLGSVAPAETIDRVIGEIEGGLA